MDEIKHFFTVYKTLENKSTSVDIFKDRVAAIEIIKKCLESYKLHIEPRVVAERKARGY